MTKKTIYILHKNGADNHYLGLMNLLHKENYTIKFREFSFFSMIFKSLINFKLNIIKKQLLNIIFFLSLFISKNKKIILGIAPYDAKLSLIMPFLKNHIVYYHTSWSCWDKSFQPKKIKNQDILKLWKFFLEKKTKHIFTVTKKSRDQIINNYNVALLKTSVVFHSLDVAFNLGPQKKKEKNSFIYFGRIIKEKGIDEILKYFKANNELKITFIGDGCLTERVKEAAKNYVNISYKPKIHNKIKLKKEIESFQFLILNSFKTKKWEELFGMSIIESMSQGIIPIATNHTGPAEIIQEKFGYLFTEGTLCKKIDQIVKLNDINEKMAKRNIKEASIYRAEKISEKWRAILN